ncbi:MAG: App1 family protein [Myxococcales bacterium]|nr:App1 family protein [Myxococcales bacterium]MCB9705000.1 App1 family protein [Myxococcales bacterium]
MAIPPLGLVLALAAAFVAGEGPRSSLKSDEELRLFPALAVAAADGGWDVDLRVWVYEPELGSWWRGLTLDGLRRALELPRAAEASAIFQERARPFLVDNERGKAIVVRVGGADHVLALTAPNGQSVTRLHLEAGALRGPSTPVSAVLREGDDRDYEGVILRIDRGGLSVVSDIDDTIKISDVRDKEALLANTFLRPLAPVPGIAEVYRRWAARGATFHYVSASPWQLYDALADFVAAEGLPAGSLHLKDFRWTDSTFWNLFQDPREYKLAAIEPLLAASPERAFVLVGDSGEADPEAYGELYRRHPAQIGGIWIRDVSGEDAGAARYEVAFAGVPEGRWAIFRDPAQLPPAPPKPANSSH